MYWLGENSVTVVPKLCVLNAVVGQISSVELKGDEFTGKVTGMGKSWDYRWIHNSLTKYIE